MRDVFPILKTIKHSKLAPLLLTLQVALTFTILVNAMNMMVTKEAELVKPTGLNESELFSFSTNLPGNQAQKSAQLEQDLAAIRALPSVASVSPITGMPLTNWGRSLDVGLTDNENDRITHAGYYGSDHTVIETLGLNLIAGRNFTPSDVIEQYYDGHKSSASVIISKQLAAKIKPQDWRSVVGDTIFVEFVPQRVIGVVDNMKAAWRFWYAYDMTVLSSVREHYEESMLVVRAKPGQRQQAMEATYSLLVQQPGRHLDNFQAFTEIKKDNLQADFAASQTLKAVIIALTFVTMLGIFGQARYTVIKRRKQIGTRRALGATRAQVLAYLLLENAIMMVAGIVLGSVLAILANMYLVNYFALSAVPGEYLLWCAGAMIAVGQLATLYPAVMAARVPPAIATRTA